MYVKYAASIEKRSDKETMWVGDDITVFENVSDSKYYIKEVYFYPSTPPEPVWLWELGHEKAIPSKAILDRLWHTRWVFHICVGGKGYYNGKPIGRGDCFLTWPYVKHSIVADVNDPFEFYWLILRGNEKMNFVHEHGFRNTRMVFPIESVDGVVKLFELGMNADFSNLNIYRYTMGLVNMIFSYYRFEGDDEALDNDILGGGYVRMAKQLLHDSNYSLHVSDVAMKLGITPKHLHKVFSRETGESVKQYITRKRFSVAEKFLRKGVPPMEVSRVLGYLNYTTFYRSFVTRYSMTPSEFAEKVSAEDGKKI